MDNQSRETEGALDGPVVVHIDNEKYSLIVLQVQHDNAIKLSIIFILYECNGTLHIVMSP